MLRTFTFALVLAGLTSCAIAQPADNVRPGEQRLNAFAFKTTHNSYERNESMASQIIDYSTYFLELDMFWDNDINGVMIEHFCSSAHNARSLQEELAEIASATLGADERIVIVYLEKKDPGAPCYNDWPDRESYRTHITNALSVTLGLENIYPSSEFIGLDQSTWPSMQELNRRGYRYVVILDEMPRVMDNLMFGVAAIANPGSPLSNVVLINQENGNDGGGRDAFVSTTGPRWLNRCYSDRDLCSLNNDAYWNESLARGFNYVATNCVDDPATIIDPRLHSPSPLYLDPFAIITQGWGTSGQPINNFTVAVFRASAGVTISARGAVYDLPNGTSISKPVTIKARGGPVTLR